MQEIVDLISSVGFPIAISIYLLYERKKVIEKNTEVINQLKTVIEKLVDKLA